MKEGIEQRLTDSVETVMGLTGGLLLVDANGEPMNFSQSFSCPDCGISIDEIEPRSFSFNNPVAPARSVTDWDSRWSLTWI